MRKTKIQSKGAGACPCLYCLPRRPAHTSKNSSKKLCFLRNHHDIFFVDELPEFVNQLNRLQVSQLCQ